MARATPSPRSSTSSRPAFTAVIIGVVTDGWLKGHPVEGQYTQISLHRGSERRLLPGHPRHPARVRGLDSLGPPKPTGASMSLAPGRPPVAQLRAGSSVRGSPALVCETQSPSLWDPLGTSPSRRVSISARCVHTPRSDGMRRRTVAQPGRPGRAERMTKPTRRHPQGEPDVLVRIVLVVAGTILAPSALVPAVSASSRENFHLDKTCAGDASEPLGYVCTVQHSTFKGFPAGTKVHYTSQIGPATSSRPRSRSRTAARAVNACGAAP